jgi:copper(I)-binding protein
MYILNGTDADEALVGAEIPGCGVVELHDMKIENDVMVMRPVEGGEIPIPAGEIVELKRGGLHVMCINKAEPLEIGSMVDIVLQFAVAGDVPVSGEVVPAGGMMMDHGDMDHDADDEEHDDMEMDHDDG